MDVLTVTGMGHRLNGDYDCDIVGMIDITSDEALTVREAHFIKTLAGARGGEIVEAFLAGDMAVRMALAAVILQRAGKRVEPDALWDASSGWARFTLAADAEQEEPAADPLAEVETTEPSTSSSGGTNTDTPSASPEGNLSRIGSPG